MYVTSGFKHCATFCKSIKKYKQYWGAWNVKKPTPNMPKHLPIRFALPVFNYFCHIHHSYLCYLNTSYFCYINLTNLSHARTSSYGDFSYFAIRMALLLLLLLLQVLKVFYLAYTRSFAFDTQFYKYMLLYSFKRICPPRTFWSLLFWLLNKAAIEHPLPFRTGTRTWKGKSEQLWYLLLRLLPIPQILSHGSLVSITRKSDRQNE